jgi:hypothetical protein
MMRYFHLPVERVVKVGLLAQAPVGNGGVRVYEHLSIQPITLDHQLQRGRTMLQGVHGLLTGGCADPAPSAKGA